ncbi:MAG TPA: hypothetical protein VGO90_09775 [Chthoniobacteraceae bacterium]|nr:hypothetical protein [Chthoniobacteraceae bacterium]
MTVNNPSGNSAVADVFNPTDYGTSGDRYGFGISICRVGAFTTTATDGWFWKINNRNSTLPQGYASGDSELVNGDEAVLYFDVAADNNTATLDLKLPASSQPNVPVHGVVDRWANSDDAKSDASGVVVSGGGATATSDANGQVTLSFPQAGRFLLSATKAGSVRGSEWITIDEAAAVAPSPIVRINRFVKCNGKYRKGTRKHRRCIRIVRAKQAAEHKAKSKN